MNRIELPQLEACGYQYRWVSAHHVRDLQQELDARHRSGSLHDEFYQRWLTGFAFQPPNGQAGARSLIVVAVPDPQRQITFSWNGKCWPLIIPPTYAGERRVDRKVEGLLSRVLEPEGYHVVQAALPLKLLAVRSGLGQYGKNNICYVPGMGTFHRLVAFYSDLPCPEDNWQELRVMESCKDCSICLRACPTGAITSERFLLRAERCITYHNESIDAFPAWIDPSWHNSLVGCMRCQKVCPENRAFLKRVERKAEFTEEETALLLGAEGRDGLPGPIIAELEQLDLMEYLEVLPRNLRTLIQCSYVP